MSTTPAFSPGPCTTCVPRVGSFFKCTRDDLYEQCSLHITLKIPSSVRFGSRPRIFCVRAYSSGVKPCSAAICGVTLRSVSIIATTAEGSERKYSQQFACSASGRLSGNANGRWPGFDVELGAGETFNHGAQNHQAVGGAERQFRGALRMRHQADNVAFAVAETCDCSERAIGIGVEIVGAGVASVGVDVTENDLLVAFEFGECGRVAEVVAFHVRDGDFEDLSGSRRASERRSRIFDPDVNLPAQKAQPLISHHRAREQACFQKNLEPVADAKHEDVGARGW